MGHATLPPLLPFPARQVNLPTPAIVSQAGVRRLPRLGLLLFCAVYVMAGFVGRAPWKRVDITSFGYMLELAHGHGAWLRPGLLGESAYFDALLPYWLGAGVIRLTPAGIDPFLAVRVLFMGLLALTLLAVWFGIYYLARTPQAQPVSFAFGGEARPSDYARALADGGLLAFVACLGLAQSAHEVGPGLVQLCASALLLYALAALPYHVFGPILAGVLGMVGLTLSGAPVLAVAFGLLGALIHARRGTEWAEQARQGLEYEQHPEELARVQRSRWYWVAGLLLLAVGCAVTSTLLDLWRWRLQPLSAQWVPWRNLLRTYLWFTWPTWPFAIWTLWRWRQMWRHQVLSRHIALPLAVIVLCTISQVISERSDTILVMSLPSYAALAAFALPTFRRSAGAFIDWFSLMFFTFAGVMLWYLWSAMLTGHPAGLAAGIDRKLSGYVPGFLWLPFLAGLGVTLGWVALARWRTRRLPPAIWKSMILPSGGVVLCWALAMTIWLPPLDFARSYVPMVQEIQRVMQQASPLPNHRESGNIAGCAQEYGLDDAQITALQYHARLTVTRDRSSTCRWLMVGEGSMPILAHALPIAPWKMLGIARRPTDPAEAIYVFVRR